MNNKTIAGHREQNNKPRGFENSWSITYRKPNYDALGDPHASYYFLNKSVHKHLYALRKSIQKQGAFTEKKKIKYMINQKIKDYNTINMTKVEAYYSKNMKSSPSISSINSGRSRSSLLNEQNSDKRLKRKKNKDKNRDLTQVSQTIDVTNEDKQKRKKLFGLPRIGNRNSEKKKTKQNQDKQKQKSLAKQESKVDISNKTQHNKFINFILQRKKKLQTQSSVAQPQQNLQKQLLAPDKQIK